MTPNEEKLRKVLQGIIDSACHPEIAQRVVLVDLKPIRKVLAETAPTRPE